AAGRGVVGAGVGVAVGAADAEWAFGRAFSSAGGRGVSVEIGGVLAGGATVAGMVAPVRTGLGVLARGVALFTLAIKSRGAPVCVLAIRSRAVCSGGISNSLGRGFSSAAGVAAALLADEGAAFSDDGAAVGVAGTAEAAGAPALPRVPFERPVFER